MLTRRHIRVKVLQSIYAFKQSKQKDLEKQEIFFVKQHGTNTRFVFVDASNACFTS
jgi:hypothetical protein